MRPRVIRDPIYGYITLAPELAPVVDHPLFQRLRGVSQTSLTSSVFPSISGSRFNHGLGAMHLAARGWDAAWAFAADAEENTCDRFIRAARHDVPELSEGPDRFGRQIGLAVAAGALLHDVGHPPFSHALEEVFREWALEGTSDEGIDPAADPLWRDLFDRRITFHEFAGRPVLDEICHDVFDDSAPSQRALHHAVRGILAAEPNDDTWAGSLHGIIAGEVDVDRLDYLIRDSHGAGTEFGAIDYQRLVDALELHVHDVEGSQTFRIAPGIRARSAVETLLVQRLQSYQWVHFHPRVVGFNIALRRAFALSTKIAHGQSIDGQAVTEGSTALLLRSFRPNLNFWDPRGVDLYGAAGLPHVDTDIPESSLSQQSIDLFGFEREHEITSGLNSRERRIEIQGAVDDATVNDTLKRAYFAASSDTATAGTPLLLQLATYARAALFRHKNFVPAWKTPEEYRGAVVRMAPTLTEKVELALEKRRAFGTAADQAVFGDLRDHLSKQFHADPIVGFNSLVDMLLSRPAVLEFLRNGLNTEAMDDTHGFWELYYAGYGLRKAPPDRIELYVGEQAVPLAERSPLVRAVAEADNSRIKLFAFFFYPTHDFGGPDAESAPMHRHRVSSRLEERFPDLVEEALENAIR